MQRSLLRLCTTAVGILWLFAFPAHAQNTLGFSVDGDPVDWGGHASSYTARHSVQPVQVNSIDIGAYNMGAGMYFRDKQDKATRGALERAIRQERPVNEFWERTFLLRFLEPVFQDAVESTVEFLVDMDADREWGEPTGPWKDFRPDYRLEVTGQDGHITRIAYYAWGGSRWEPWPDEELRGIEVAAAGRFLEVAISLSILGSPRIAPHKVGTTDQYMVQDAFRTHQGESWDYLPFAGEFSDHEGEWLPFWWWLTPTTAIRPHSWGRLKGSK